MKQLFYVFVILGLVLFLLQTGFVRHIISDSVTTFNTRFYGTYSTNNNNETIPTLIIGSK